jgi:hypothetical protein
MKQVRSQSDRLSRFPRRPHRLVVLVILMLALASGFLAWQNSRYQRRWPRAAINETVSDVTETDAAKQLHHPGDPLSSSKRRGGRPATGFHANAS